MPFLNSPGVYCILNLVNGKRYVGSSGSVADRIKWHRTYLTKGRHGNDHLQRAWNKHGPSKFKFSILIMCNAEEVIALEQRYIDLFKAADSRFGYNKSPSAASVLGIKRSLETRAKLSKAAKGRKLPPDQLAAMSKRMLGKKWRLSSRLKMVASRTGQKHSEETKRKIGNAHLGMKRSAEARAKMSAAQRGKKLSIGTRRKMSLARTNPSPETRAKLSAAARGRKKSPESIEKTAAAHRGMKRSLESRLKMSLSAKARCLRKRLEQS